MSLVTLDLEFTRTNLDHDSELIRALMQIAVEDLRIFAIELRSALTRNEPEQLRRLAHAMKGLAANFRAEPLTKLTSQIENATLPKDRPEDQRVLQRLVDEVSINCEYTVLELVSELRAMNDAKTVTSRAVVE